MAPKTYVAFVVVGLTLLMEAQSQVVTDEVHYDGAGAVAGEAVDIANPSPTPTADFPWAETAQDSLGAIGTGQWFGSGPTPTPSPNPHPAAGFPWAGTAQDPFGGVSAGQWFADGPTPT